MSELRTFGIWLMGIATGGAAALALETWLR